MQKQTDTSVTVIVRDQVKKTHLPAYESWLEEVHERLISSEGFLGLGVIPPEMDSQQNGWEYCTVFRFDTYVNLRKWQDSDFLEKRMGEASEYVHSETDIQYLEGMELWFDRFEQENRPRYWKQVLVTIFTVYPLIIGADIVLNMMYPMRTLRPEVAIFFTVIIVASLMVYPVMPWIAKLTEAWIRR